MRKTIAVSVSKQNETIKSRCWALGTANNSIQSNPAALLRWVASSFRWVERKIKRTVWNVHESFIWRRESHHSELILWYYITIITCRDDGNKKRWIRLRLSWAGRWNWDSSSQSSLAVNKVGYGRDTLYIIWQVDGRNNSNGWLNK